MSDPTKDESPPAAIARLKDHVAQMADLSIAMVADGTRALLTSDTALAESVIARDAPLDRFDVEIEAEVIRLMAITQPEGPDLRTLGATLKIANCIDRVGRLGYDLARNLSQGPEAANREHQELLRRMDEHARAMVAQAVHAFVRGDAAEAKQVFALDDEVDALYTEVQGRLIGLLQQGGLPVERLAHEILAARHLERVGDNACKIAEKAVYAITGERRTEYFPTLAHRTPGGRMIP